MEVMMKELLRIDGARLWASLMEMAKIGATKNGGVHRLALTEEDRRGRELFTRWCCEAGMRVRTDEAGNLFARREGLNQGAAPVLMGSHLDTQPEGGRFDGVYGVLAALEVVRALNDAGVTTERPIEICSWTNEEGVRFAPAMLGSAVFTGVMPLTEALRCRDADGVTLGEALNACGVRGSQLATRVVIDAYFEAHIEQGPILEANGTTIGVVTGGQAIRWFDVKVTGMAAHAGTTPRRYRRDAFLGAAQMALEIDRIISCHRPLGLVTIGQVQIVNWSRNTIAASLTFTVDMRHPDDAQIDAMESDLRAVCASVAYARGLNVAIVRCWSSPATSFDIECVDLVAQAATALDYSSERIVSGAGHDAIHLARYCPTAMLFIPCVGGISHNEAENALPEDVAAGANVLLNAVAVRAGACISATVQT